MLMKTSAIVVEVPSSEWNEDINIAWSTTIQWDENTIFELIQQVNLYLRFAIWAICMWVFVYSGFMLISSSWNEDQSKKANNMLVGASVWIVVAIVSYTAVRLLINLFE